MRRIASPSSSPRAHLPPRAALFAAAALLLPGNVLAQAPSHGAASPDGPGEHAGHGAARVAGAPGRVQVLHHPDERDLVARLGPFSLPAEGHAMRLTAAEVVELPVDGWLISFQARILDVHGRELPPEILHHINVVRPDRRELFFPVMQRVAAAGRETGRIAAPFPFGIAVSAGDTLLVSAMLHNPTGAPVEIVVEATLHYDTPAWLNRVAVEPFHLDINPPPAGASFDLPPGRSELTWEGSPAVDAAILALGGHMHAYGDELRLEEVGADSATHVLWRTRPEFDDDGRVARIPRKSFVLRLGLGISADRTYRLVAVYDNPTGRTIPGGGMAEIAGVVRARGPWPEADHADPWFHADYAEFTRFNPALRRPYADPASGSAEQEHAHHP